MSDFDNSPHVLRPHQQRSRDALAKIVSATEQILRTHGPEAFSIAAVAAASGLPVGNIYRRFRSKEDILLVLKDDVTLRVEHAVIEKAERPYARVEDFVTAFVSAMADQFEKDEIIHKALFDPRIRTSAMERTGTAARRRVLGHYRAKMATLLPEKDRKRSDTVIAISFNIIAYGVIGRAAAVDPLLTSFSWKEISTEYTLAAISYLKNQLGTTAKPEIPPLLPTVAGDRPDAEHGKTGG